MFSHVSKQKHTHRNSARYARGLCRAAGILIALFLLMNTAAASETKKIDLVLHWKPQAQFAGFFVALEKGFYAQYGLDLDIISGGPDTNPARMLQTGEADYATMFLSAAIRHRNRGVPLVAVAQIVQDSALMLVAKKSAGIEDLHDLDGARVGTWSKDFQIQPEALFERESLDVEMIRQSPTFELFMRGGVDAVTAMWYNEYHTLIGYGLNPDELTAFFFSDLGLDIPEDGIYCLESTWARDPEITRKLVQATLEGWRYAFDHPEEALDIVISVMKSEKVGANRVHQEWMLSRMQEVIVGKGENSLNPRLKREDFRLTVDVLMNAGVLPLPIDYEDFCRGPAK
jgi:NitT/TauT family transport system substrate-binding protein